MLPESFFKGLHQFKIRIDDKATLPADQMDMGPMLGGGIEDQPRSQRAERQQGD